MPPSLHGLRDDIRAFADERDWAQFHSPRSLTLALTGEVGELAALLRFLDDTAVYELLSTTDGRAAITEEIADIAIFLVRLADVCHVDIATAVTEKIEVNGVRYPVNQARGSAAKYTELRPSDSERPGGTS